MTAKPFHILDLLNKHFNIPYYQRGYRWEEKQVVDLLKDLKDFHYSENKHKGEFYCLQPLVVVVNNELSNKQGVTVYDVIDGQQRLTTLYLILQYAFNHDTEIKRKYGDRMYSLQYERLALEESKKIFDIKNLLELNDTSKGYLRSNTDFYFMFRCVQTMIKWFESVGNLSSSSICQVILGDGFDEREFEDESEEEIEATKNEVNDVRFLWYEPDEEIEIQKSALSGSIGIFSRLNYGQRPLTSTDLIKAHLLITDIYPENCKKQREEISIRHANEWDMMEQRLHDRLLWAMLTPIGYNPESRMELLLDYVARSLFDEKDESGKTKKIFENIKTDDKDFSYRVISSFLLSGGGKTIKPEKYSKKVEEVWKKTQDIYHTFCNWYNNRETYHLIGLYILLQDKITGGKGWDDKYVIYNKLIKLCADSTKAQFVDKIKKLVGDEVRINSMADKDTPYTLETITYTDNKSKKDLIRVLALFNVNLTMEKKAEGALFDFDLFKFTKCVSLEHIHPQNLNVDDLTKEELTEWYNKRKEILKQEDKVTDKIQKAFDYLDSNIQFAKKEEIKDNCQRQLNIIDSIFDELADNISTAEMHTIRNMALIDSRVNSGFSNNLLDEKRKLMYKYADETDSNGNPKHYIMRGTELVFNKMFTPKDLIKDMKFWGNHDRDAYFKQIQNTYDLYTSTINNMNDGQQQ